MAYIKHIQQNAVDSHQTSPAYALTFTRWSNRDTKNYTFEDAKSVRTPLVVINDAINITVQDNKTSMASVFSCTLKAGDINYMTAIHPGDFVMVNIVNDEQKALDIRERALKLEPINKYEDGFKGVFKIKEVRAEISTAANGVKQYTFVVTGMSFDEFNNNIYYNPAVTEKFAQAAQILFLSQFGKYWSEMLQKKEANNIQSLLKNIIRSTLGHGTKQATDGAVPQDQVPRYILPKQLAKLLGIEPKGEFYASDLYTCYLGIWQGLSSSSNDKLKNIPPQKGFNNGFKTKKNSTASINSKNKKDFKDEFFYETSVKLQGSRQVAPQDFNMVKVWSLLQEYSNPIINEMYTANRVDVNGYIKPSLIVRQKPFNNNHYKSEFPHTKFLDLPRWKISPDLMLSLSVGRNDQARINFVQIFARPLSVNQQTNQVAQIIQQNFVSDDKDILRSGLKPYISNVNFDYANNEREPRSAEWAKLVGDWVFNGHLKLNGGMTFAGIEDPICVGDNLEFDDIVFHIESVQHVLNISADGIKQFRTSVQLSHGMDLKSSSTKPVYGEMDHTDSFSKRKEDFDRENVLPGFSDTQDLPGSSRVLGEEVKETKQKSFTDPNSPNKKGK